MQINTKYFGELSINEEDIIRFPNGIPGFVDEKEFVLLPLEDNPIFQVLQCTSNLDPAFIVTNPYYFIKEYEFNLDDPTLDLLEIESENDVQVYSIVSLKEPFEKSTANLQAPLVINLKRQLAKQYITNSRDYSTKEAIFSESLIVQAKGD